MKHQPYARRVWQPGSQLHPAQSQTDTVAGARAGLGSGHDRFFVSVHINHSHHQPALGIFGGHRFQAHTASQGVLRARSAHCWRNAKSSYPSHVPPVAEQDTESMCAMRRVPLGRNVSWQGVEKVKTRTQHSNSVDLDWASPCRCCRRRRPRFPSGSGQYQTRI